MELSHSNNRNNFSRYIRTATLVFVLSIVVFNLISYTPPAFAQASYGTLVWSDEFNGTSLNRANWNFEVGGGGWGNKELEYYTGGQNVSVANGVLTITAKKESDGKTCWYGPCQYTSARINTKGKHFWTYGKVEARIAMPLTQGTWPGFWMLGTDIDKVGWPKSGEIDIMEHVNKEGFVNGTIHWYDRKVSQYTCRSGAISNLAGGYHIYDIIWDKNNITWYVDGTQYCQASIRGNNMRAFHLPFYIVFDMAVGGAMPQSPNGSSVFPAQMMIDYVRVYR